MTRRQRFVACGFDLLVATGIGLIPSLAMPFAGVPLAAIYLLVCDGCFQGQSLGKRLCGLRVVHGASPQPCGVGRSCARNVLWLIPLISLLLAVEALWRVGHEAPGRHWGDRLADTTVVPAGS